MYNNWLVKLCSDEPQELESVVEVRGTGLDYLQEKIAEAEQLGYELAHESPQLLELEDLRMTVNDLSDEDAIKIAAMMDKEAGVLGSALGAVKNFAGRALSSGAGRKAIRWGAKNPMMAAGLGGAAVGGVHSKATGGSFMGGAALGGAMGYGAGRLAGGKAIARGLGRAKGWGARRTASGVSSLAPTASAIGPRSMVGGWGEEGIQMGKARQMGLHGPARQSGKYAEATEALYKEAFFQAIKGIAKGGIKGMGGRAMSAAGAHPVATGALLGAGGGALAGGEGNRFSGAMMGAGVGAGVGAGAAALGRRAAQGAAKAPQQFAHGPQFPAGMRGGAVKAAPQAEAGIAGVRQRTIAADNLGEVGTAAHKAELDELARHSGVRKTPPPAPSPKPLKPWDRKPGQTADFDPKAQPFNPEAQGLMPLQKRAAQMMKIAMLCDAGGDGNWLSQFEGTPLLDKAIEIETQLLEAEKADMEQRIQERASRPPLDASRDLWDMQDKMRLEKKMLELQLVTQRNSQDVSETYQQAGMEPAPPDPAQQAEVENTANSAEASSIPSPGQIKTAKDESSVSPGIGAMAGGALAGGALGGLGGADMASRKFPVFTFDPKVHAKATKAINRAGRRGGVVGAAAGAALGGYLSHRNKKNKQRASLPQVPLA